MTDAKTKLLSDDSNQLHVGIQPVEKAVSEKKVTFYEEFDDHRSVNTAEKWADNASIQSAGQQNLDPENALLILTMAYSVFFSRYTVATALSSFFPQKAAEIGISSTMNGIIFASYPAGIAITSMLSPPFILRTGTRTVVAASLACTSFCSLLFGFTPDLVDRITDNDHVQSYFFLIFYFLNGLCGGFAECGTTMMLTFEFKHRLAAVTAAIGTVCGLGCMAGPTIGGVIYGLGGSETSSFRLPFIFLAGVEIMLSFLCAFYFKEIRRPPEDDPHAAKPGQEGVMSPSRVLTLGAIALSGTIVATLDPTLAYRLDEAPYHYNSAKIGLVFMVSSIAYTLVSIPCGWAVDQLPYDNLPYASRMCKRIQAAGFYSLAICFAMLGPFKYPDTWEFFDNVPSGWIGMIIKGVGSSGNNAGYPDLVLGLDEDDEVLQARISGLWNAAYALGWAFGPVLGGVLYELLDFDGYASITAMISLVYAVILTISSLPTVDLGVKQHPVEKLDEVDGKTLVSVSTVMSFHSHRSKR